MGMGAPYDYAYYLKIYMNNHNLELDFSSSLIDFEIGLGVFIHNERWKQRG